MRRGDEAAIFNPSRDPGEIPGTSHLTASEGTLWAGQPGLSRSERLVPWAWGRHGGQGSWVLTWALHSFPYPRSARACPGSPLSSGKEAAGSRTATSRWLWPKASCPPAVSVLIRRLGGEESLDSRRLCLHTDFCNIQISATFCKGLAGLSPPASQEPGRMQLSNTLLSAHCPPSGASRGPQPLLCPNTPAPFCAQGV